ncbi:alkaline phosphatase [Thalassotalea ganghwensis]
MNKILKISALTLLTFSGITLANSDAATLDENKKVKNVIMIVGDGMGPSYTSAYRYYMDDINTEEIEQTVFDRHLVGMSSTYPAQESGHVTDSAAGATALATGHKSYNGAISVDVDKKPLSTVLQHAKSIGKKTGAVVTSQVNHATPASYITHNESRRNYNEIADSYIDNGINVDVLLGGGTHYFIRDDRNLVEEFKQKGFHYIDNYQGLINLPKDQPVIGLFAPKGLPWALDDTERYRLSKMTKAALSQLESDNGFFLLIEASQVDWAGHSNDIAAAMAEMDDLAKTVEYLEQYVTSNPDTLVVMTADHSTGGLTLGANGEYKWLPQQFKAISQSPTSIAKTLAEQKLSKAELESLLTFSLSEAQYTTLLETKNDKAYSDNNYKKQSALYKAITALISEKSYTGWTSTGHTAIDVPVFAIGKKKQRFEGLIDNTDIAKLIYSLM